jgi:hypothetical protein
MTVTRADLEAIMNGPHRATYTVAKGNRPVKVRGARKDPVPSGHVLPPGSGPAGETCKGCAHRVVVRLAKSYQKCGLARDSWTGGRKTDIRVTDAACAKWEPVTTDET